MHPVALAVAALAVVLVSGCGERAEQLRTAASPPASPPPSPATDPRALDCGDLPLMSVIADSFADRGGAATAEEAAHALAGFGRDFDPAEHDVEVGEGEVSYRREGRLVARVQLRVLSDGTYDAEALEACSDQPAPQG